MQENGLDVLKESLRTHGISGGLQGLINLAETIGEKYGIQVKPTCDAKYLEVGTTSKSDNVDCILNRICSENQIFRKNVFTLEMSLSESSRGSLEATASCRQKKAERAIFLMCRK